MDRRYKHLDGAERGVILAEHRRGASLREIGGLLGRAPLRANKSETFDCLKFTLEGAGERSDGNARTPAHARLA